MWFISLGAVGWGAWSTLMLHAILRIKTLRLTFLLFFHYFFFRKELVEIVPNSLSFMCFFLCLNCIESFNTETCMRQKKRQTRSERKMFFRETRIEILTVRRPAESLEWIIDFFKIKTSIRTAKLVTKYCLQCKETRVSSDTISISRGFVLAKGEEKLTGNGLLPDWFLVEFFSSWGFVGFMVTNDWIGSAESHLLGLWRIVSLYQRSLSLAWN